MSVYSPITESSAGVTRDCFLGRDGGVPIARAHPRIQGRTAP